MSDHNTRERDLGVPCLQYSKAETTSNSDLLLMLHVEVPDNEPRENREGEVGGDELCCNRDQD